MAQGFFGILLIVYGVLFLLARMGYVNAWSYVVPVFLITVGGWQLLFGGSNKRGGGIILAIGVVFLFVRWGAIPGAILANLWPIVLIVIGLWFLFGRRGRAPQSTSNNHIKVWSAFGANETSVDASEFQGGDATSLFGSVTVDLRRTKMAPGGAVIDLFAAFGGIELLVPEDWVVNVQTVAIFGGVDNRANRRSGEVDDRHVLTLRGMVIFGGVDIKV